MKKSITNKSIPKPLYIFIIVSISMTFAMYGALTILKMEIYSSVISGESMEKTLSDGTKIILITDDIKPVKRGDIVSIKAYNENDEIIYIVKRIIGLPNEEIEIKGNKIFINGNILEEPYAYYSGTSNDNLILKLGNDKYFVMGDNRMNSMDSRVLGPIPKEFIVSTILKYRE